MSRHFVRLMLVVFAVAAPSVTSAQSGQSAIAGVVRDSTGACPAWRHRRGQQSGLDREVAVGSHRRGRSVSRRRSAAGHLPGHLHASRGSPPSSGTASCSSRTSWRRSTWTWRSAASSRAITVTGESPIVDVQSSQRREVVNSEMLEALPTGRSFVTMAGTVPAVLDRAVRRRRLDLDVAGRQPDGARLLERGFANAHRRDGRRCDVRRWPVRVRLRQRGPDAGNRRPGQCGQRREPAVRRAGQPHSANRGQHAVGASS